MTVAVNLFKRGNHKGKELSIRTLRIGPKKFENLTLTPAAWPWLLRSSDDGVFQFTRTVDGLTLASDIQIYFDLLQVGQRGPDAAEALRRWEGFNR